MTLLLNTLYELTDLVDATDFNKTIKWAVDGDPSIIASGVVRGFTHADGSPLTGTDDVLASYVWITGSAEFFLPVQHLLELMAESLVTLPD